MKTEYSHVKIPLNTVVGATVQALSNRNGTRLTRVTEDGRDDLVVSRPGKPDVHLAWVQVKGGVALGLLDGPKVPFPQGLLSKAGEAALARGGLGAAGVLAGLSRLADDEEEATGEPKNDQVRVTKRRGVAK